MGVVQAHSLFLVLSAQTKNREGNFIRIDPEPLRYDGNSENSCVEFMQWPEFHRKFEKANSTSNTRARERSLFRLAPSRSNSAFSLRASATGTGRSRK